VFERREAAPKAVDDAAPTPEVRPAAPAPKEKVEAAAAKPAPAPAKPAETAASKPAAPVATTKPAPAPVKPVAAAPVQTAAAPKADAAPISLVGGEFKPAFKAGGGFAVQLAASSTEEGANAEWTRRTAKAPELFASAERMIVKADVNGRTVYRVRAGSFATAADADAFCGALKARGGECFRAVK
jgi:septal ring-binding cell division protein DamX